MMNDAWLKDQLVLALAIMDEKGKETDNSVWLWTRDWGRLRSTLLECHDYVGVNADLLAACEAGLEMLDALREDEGVGRILAPGVKDLYRGIAEQMRAALRRAKGDDDE